MTQINSSNPIQTQSKNTPIQGNSSRPILNLSRSVPRTWPYTVVVEKERSEPIHARSGPRPSPRSIPRGHDDTRNHARRPVLVRMQLAGAFLLASTAGLVSTNTAAAAHQPNSQSNTAIAAAVSSGATATTATSASTTESYSRTAQSVTTESLVNLIADRLLRGDDASRERTLIALRRLRDPKLRPLFAEFASSADAVLRLHGIMGLAELEPDRPVDTLLIRRLEEPSQVAAILGRALRDYRLSADELSDIARWPDLDPSIRAIIFGRLDRLGRPVPAANYRAEISEQRPVASVIAALHLIHRGDATDQDRKPIDNLLKPLTPQQSSTSSSTGDAAAAERRLLISTTLDLVRGEQLAGCASVVESILAQTPLADTALRREALWTLAIAAPNAANTLNLWKTELARDDLSRADRLRLALASADAAARIGTSTLTAQDAGTSTSPNPVSQLFAGQSSDAVAATLGRVGVLAASNDFNQQADTEALESLLADGYAPGFTWAIGWARALETQSRINAARNAASASTSNGQNSASPRQCQISARAINAWRIIFEKARFARRNEPGALEWIMDAATSLCDADPGFVQPTLTTAVERQDAVLIEAILAGALRSINPQVINLTTPFVGPAAQPSAAELSPVATGLASLIAARHTNDRDPVRMQALAELALADGRSSAAPALPTVFRVQAAWLALRAGGRDREAMARLLDASRPVANVPTNNSGD